MREDIRDTFYAVGIRHVGVCSFSALPSLLKTRAESRLPLFPKSVIACALPYYCGEYPQRNVARYAICDDYHITGGALMEEVRAALEEAFPGHAFAGFMDISPIPEVEAARLAGLGAIGLHRQLILPEYGAYAFIGCIVTDLALEPSHPAAGSCLLCGACLSACPTGALSRGGFKADRCRSLITQKKGSLSMWEEEQVRTGKMAWGCDICLDACPMNRDALHTPLGCMRQAPMPTLSRDKLEEAVKSRAYGYRGRGVLERNLRLLGL